jgi:hypothetical protein
LDGFDAVSLFFFFRRRLHWLLVAERQGSRASLAVFELSRRDQTWTSTKRPPFARRSIA